MRALLAIAICVNVALSAAVYMDRRKVARLDTTIDSLAVVVAMSRAERSALVATVADFPFRGPLMDGIDARSGTPLTVTVDSLRSQVVYLVSSGCRACEINFPFLDSLARGHAAQQIVAFSRTDDADDLSRYARRHHIAFPVLSKPVGYAERLLPRFSVPLTGVLQRGRLIAIMRGTLKDDEKSSIRALFAHEVRDSYTVSPMKE